MLLAKWTACVVAGICKTSSRQRSSSRKSASLSKSQGSGSFSGGRLFMPAFLCGLRGGMSGAQRGRLEVLLPVRTLYLYLVARIAPGEKVCQGCIRTCSRLTSYHTRFYMTYIV